MKPPKPYKIVKRTGMSAHIVERATGNQIGLVTAWANQDDPEGSHWRTYYYPNATNQSFACDAGAGRTVAEAAALVYAAHLKRSSEGNKE